MAPDYSVIKDQILTLTKRLGELANHINLDHIKERLLELDEMSSSTTFWDNHDQAQKTIKKAAAIRSKIKKWEEISTSLEDADLLITMAHEESDIEVLEDGWNEIEIVSTKIETMEIGELLSHKLDGQNAVLAINAGAGGVEAMDWAEMLQRMFLRYCLHHDLKATIVDLQPGAEAGIASCTIMVEGEYAYGYLKSESGVHRLVRISPFDSAARRHTSFASVLITPDLDDTIEVEVNDEDLRVDVYRASGAGGQHVNKTESAVRLTHLPTGLVAACQNERSQHMNKATAMRMLKAKIYQVKLKEQEERMDSIVGAKQRIDFGSQIRSYVLAPYRLVTDHRTDLKVGNVTGVLDGNLDSLIHSYLVKFGGSKK
jgi:peptide chain release factor 2